MSIFSKVQFSKPKQNKFDLSHEKKMTFDMGTMIPTFIQEIMPGDKMKLNQEYLIRLQPMLAPIYHRVKIKTDYFFVPYRLVWDEWDKFISGGERGTDNPIPPSLPYASYNYASWSKGTLADYLGVPVAKDNTVQGETQINALPFRAYQLIWQEYYRDENLQDKPTITKNSGEINGAAEFNATTELRMRAWEKDYFTSALPWAQKGGEVSIPTDLNEFYPSLVTTGTADPNGPPAANQTLSTDAGGFLKTTAGSAYLHTLESIGITINNLRTSARLQEWLEKNARAGSRLAEFVLAHFGVISDDLRLGRPQYLGGHANPVSISEVLNTTTQWDTTADTPAGYPQGYMAGHGVSAGSNSGFSGYFKEHGIVIGITSVLPKAGYNQGLPRMFNRFDRFEYPFPSFAHLGEQEVKLSEVYFQPYDVNYNKDKTFGYQSRYADWKYVPNSTHGDFRDNLDYWHMDRIFSNEPQLNEEFIKCNATRRIFAVETGNHILANIYNNASVVRSLPYFSNPKL